MPTARDHFAPNPGRRADAARGRAPSERRTKRPSRASDRNGGSGKATESPRERAGAPANERCDVKRPPPKLNVLRSTLSVARHARLPASGSFFRQLTLG